MKASDACIDLIMRSEGCRLTAYPDPGTGAEPWTIGVGHTGPEVYEGMTIDQDQADAYLRQDIEKFERCVSLALDDVVTQGQFDALVCFAFNVGCRAMAGSTLLRLVNEGKMDAAAAQFPRWNKSGGRVMAGLTRRRLAEQELFLS